MLTKTSVPEAPCVTLDELKAHLREDTGLEDAIMQSYLDAAIDACAYDCARALNLQDYRQTFDAWYRPDWCQSPNTLDIAPVKAVASLSYFDEDGAEQTVDGANWYWQRTNAGAFIGFVDGFTVPTIRARPDQIFVDFTAGYDPEEAEDPEFILPDVARAAILLTASHLFENREGVVLGRAPFVLPLGIKSLLDRIRIYR